MRPSGSSGRALGPAAIHVDRPHARSSLGLKREAGAGDDACHQGGRVCRRAEGIAAKLPDSVLEARVLPAVSDVSPAKERKVFAAVWAKAFVRRSICG
jgi:hypothetical protein